MPYCHNCGNFVSPEQKECQYCGINLKVKQTSSTGYDDDGGALWGLLGFCVPIAGLLVYLLWRDTRPLTARSAGIGVLISVCLGVAFLIIYMLFVFSMFV